MRTVTLVRHRVADFDSWKQTYDGFSGVQKEKGVRWHQVMRSSEDPNLVVVVHAFDSPAAARAFFDDPQLADAMERAGVDRSTVEMETLEEVVAGAF